MSNGNIPTPTENGNSSYSLFGQLAETIPVVHAGPSLLMSIGADLLRSDLPDGGWGEALVHIPKGAGDEFRNRLGLSEPIRHGGLYALSFGKDGGQTTVRSCGKLGRLDPLRQELLILVIRTDLCALISSLSSEPSIDSAGKHWHSLVSSAPADAAIATNRLALHLAHSAPEASLLADELGRQIGLHSANYDPAHQARLFGARLTAIGEDLEQRSRRNERDIRWFRTVTKIQDAVGWELDSNRLNNAIAKVLKSSIGYDLLELQALQQTGRKYVIASNFQRNDTSYGGELLNVILKPEKQEELLRGHKPVILNRANVSQYMMNPLLFTLMGLESGILTPLIYRRKPNGLIKLFSRHAGHFREDDLDRMEAIGRVIAKSLENAKIHALMRRMATVDGLTNVYNHRFFTEQLIREFKRAHRYDSSLTLIMIDIDHFKQFNDNNGHLQGDYVLSHVASILKNNVREVDLVCRYGGEEFVVVLPETDIEKGSIVAEKIRRAVEEFPFKSENKQPGGKLTISLGIASGIADLVSPTELVNRADMALYRAKKLGRNRCEAY